MGDESQDSLAELVGEAIVLDLASPWVYIGRLVAARQDYLILDSADAHDLRDTTKTREKYVLDVVEHGLHVNRRKVWVSRQGVVGISRLTDVVLE